MDLLTQKKFFCDSENFKKLRYFFLITMFLCLFARNIEAYLLVPPVFDLAVFSFLGMSGVGLIALGILSKNIVVDLKNNIFLLLFLCMIIISAIANVEYGFFKNLKDISWSAISFLILYMSCKDETKEEKINLLFTIQNIVILVWTILSFISILTAILQISYIFEIREGCWFRVGIVENRLFGIFMNPNVASAVAFVSVLFSFYQIFSKSDLGLKRSLNITNIVIQFIYISLSESRGCLMVMVIASLITTFCLFYRKIGKNKKPVKILFSGILSLICSAGLVVSVLSVPKVFDLIPSFIQESSLDTNNTKLTRRIVMQRTDFVDNGDVSNLRFSIWLSSLEIFKKKWLFGVSAGNLVKYAKEVLPDTFIARRGYTRTHNIWIGVFVYTGILGGICWILFFISYLIKLIKYYKRVTVYKAPQIFNLSVLLVICTCFYGLVESEMLFVNSLYSFIFWVFLGYVTYHLNSFKENTRLQP